MSQSATQHKRPDWDSKGVAEPYLTALWEEAREGRFELSNVECLMSTCVEELRATYQTQNIDRALEGLERILSNIERRAREVHEGTARPARAQPAPPHVASTPAKPLAPAATTTPRQASALLDARALRTSAFGTWLGLVAGSWFALIWGAVITTPVGIGLGIFASMFAGMFFVPLWGTAFGFLGMGSARNATLRALEYAPLPMEDPLQQKLKQYASYLGIPVPELGSVPAFNAFAVGSDVNNAAIAIGSPLRQTLAPQEVNAVLGHELGHIISGDMRKTMLMRTFQNATVWFLVFNQCKQFGRWVLNFAAELWILRHSRQREFWADAIGAELAGKDAMIGALRKLDKGPALSSMEDTHARLMLRGRVNGVFRTHPTPDQRIEALINETYLKRLPRRHG